MTARKGQPTARQKIEQSMLSPRAISGTQGYGDVDTEQLHFLLKQKLLIDVTQANTDITVTRSIEGSSTLKIDLIDNARTILRSGVVTSGVDIQLDGLWFRLQQCTKQASSLSLTFEDREIAILRTYYKKLGPVSRDKVTRAQFVLRLIKEVKEVDIQYFIPELITVQPVAKGVDLQTFTPPAANTTQGGLPTSGGNAGAPALSPRLTRGESSVPSSLGLTVKNSPMTDTQAKNANAILDTATSLKVRRKVMVTAIMVAIQESSITNLTDAQSPGTRSGVYQQDPRYWPASGDVAKDAAAFLSRADGIDRKYPNLNYFDLGEQVQRSGLPQLYAPWRTEAERIVNAYGQTGGDVTGVSGSTTDTTMLAGGSDYFFYRGVPPTKANGKWGNENSWTAIQRMASDVNWRAFSVGGIVYFLTEDWLFKSQPAHRISEDSPGILDISGDIDSRKKNGVLTIQAMMKRWAAPPGTMIELFDMGPYDGKWLVTETSRSVYDKQGTITIKQPEAALPEPATGNLQGQAGFSGASINIPSTTGTQYQSGTSIINPVAPGFGSDGTPGGIHDTDGLSGKANPAGGTWPHQDALDFFAKPGTPVLAAEGGTVIKFSGHDPILGPVLGAGGPLGWSVYIKGESGSVEYYTHLQTRTTFVGADISIGEQIGTVADYDKYGRRSHVHMGVAPGPAGHPNILDFAKAPQALVAGAVKTAPPDEVTDQNVPLFTSEGPQFYDAAFAHNSPFATGGPYKTVLDVTTEAKFRAWVTTNSVPFDPDENPTDYDMRGFYVAMLAGDVPSWHGGHFPDTWKTPYDTTFSKDSQYSTANCPFVWRGNTLIDSRNAQVIFRSTQ